MIARDILVAEAEGKADSPGAMSLTRGGVQLVREAKARGVRVTAETTPHYIGATDEWVIGYDSRCRVNPPLREESEQAGLHRRPLGRHDRRDRDRPRAAP